MVPTIDPEDELICLGHEEDTAAHGGAMAPPIVQTSNFAFPSTEVLMDGLAREHEVPVYSRGLNPTVAAVEEKLARLERGEDCRCFASGMGAISAVFLGLLRAGDHVLFVNQVYGPTLQLAGHLRRFGIAHDVVLDLDLESIAGALRSETRLLWLESPGTMLFRQVDLDGVVALARERGLWTAIDNSWATPLFQKPLTHGIDLVVHSATKYLAGHSDVVAGAVVGSRELLEEIFYNALLLNGAVLAPFDAWLLNRGLRTLPVRMARHHANGLAVARFLEGHPSVRRVFHPALRSSSHRPAAPGPLRGTSGLLSFALEAARHAQVARVVDRLRRFRIGVSWGGVESLVLTPNRGDQHAEALQAQGIPAGTIRLSVGLEDPDVLIDDLAQALSSLDG